MADEKISQMPFADGVSNSDVLPIVQGGVNKQVAKSSFLTADEGEGIVIGDGTGAGCGTDGEGSVFCQAINGDGILGDADGGVRITTSNGSVKIVGTLPTSDPHVAGQFWNSAGVLHISAG